MSARKDWTYHHSDHGKHGLMRCGFCGKEIVGQYRARDAGDKFVTHHRGCSADDANWARLDRERLSELQALYEECGDADTAGKLAYVEGKDLHDNPHWEVCASEQYQTIKALDWRDGYEAEHDADTTRAAKERAMGIRTTKEIAMAEKKPVQIGDRVTVGIATETLVLVAIDGEEAFLRYDEGRHKVCRIEDLEYANSRAWYQAQADRAPSHGVQS